MDQFYKLLEYLVNGIISNTDLPYFLLLLFGSEMLKRLTVPAENGKRTFKFHKKFSFQFRYVVLVFGMLMVYPIYLLEMPEDIRSFLLKTVITYAITTSFYELISAIIFKKTAQVLTVIRDAKIKPMVIDPNEMMSTGFTGDGSNTYGSETVEVTNTTEQTQVVNYSVSSTQPTEATDDSTIYTTDETNDTGQDS